MPIILANLNLLPFLSPRVGPTGKGSEYGAKIRARFILNKMKNLSIISNASQPPDAGVSHANVDLGEADVAPPAQAQPTANAQPTASVGL